MNRRSFRVILTTIAILFMTVAPAFAEDIDAIAKVNASKLGIITIIPPLLAIALAFITKNVVISLFLGVLSGSFILQLVNGEGFLAAIPLSFLDFISRALTSLADPWNAGIIMRSEEHTSELQSRQYLV